MVICRLIGFSHEPFSVLLQIDGTNGTLETTLVGILRLVKTRIETNVHDSILFFIVNSLHTERLEEEGFGFFKDFLTTLAASNVVSNLYSLGCLGAPDRGIRWIRKEILAQSFREGTLKVGNVERDSSDLVVKEDCDGKARGKVRTRLRISN
jgi:hypothetical protein